MKEIMIYTTIELYNMLTNAIKTGMDQSIINKLAYDFVCRIYVPFTNMNFDEMLLQYGYVDIKKIRGK